MNDKYRKQENTEKKDLARALIGNEVAEAFNKLFTDDLGKEPGQDPAWVTRVVEGIKRKGQEDNKSEEQINDEVNKFHKGRMVGRQEGFDYDQAQNELQELKEKGKEDSFEYKYLQRQIKGEKLISEVSNNDLASTLASILQHDTKFNDYLKDESISDVALVGTGISSSNIYRNNPAKIAEAIDQKSNFNFKSLSKFFEDYGFHMAMIEDKSDSYIKIWDESTKDDWNIDRIIKQERKGKDPEFTKVKEMVVRATTEGKSEPKNENSSKYAPENAKTGNHDYPNSYEGDRQNNHSGDSALPKDNTVPSVHNKVIVDPFHTIGSRFKEARDMRILGKRIKSDLSTAEQSIGERVGMLDDAAYSDNGLFLNQADNIVNLALNALKPRDLFKNDSETRGKLSELSSHMKTLRQDIQDRIKADEQKPDAEKMAADERSRLEKLDKLVKEIVDTLKQLMDFAKGKSAKNPSPAP